MPVHSLYEAHRSSTFVRKYHDYRFADNRNVPPWLRFQPYPLGPKPSIFQFSKSLGVTFFVASYTFDIKARNRSRERENGVKTRQNDLDVDVVPRNDRVTCCWRAPASKSLGRDAGTGIGQATLLRHCVRCSTADERARVRIDSRECARLCVLEHVRVTRAYIRRMHVGLAVVKRTTAGVVPCTNVHADHGRAIRMHTAHARTCASKSTGSAHALVHFHDMYRKRTS